MRQKKKKKKNGNQLQKNHQFTQKWPKMPLLECKLHVFMWGPDTHMQDYY
jgi:hypothetical protein